MSPHFFHILSPTEILSPLLLHNQGALQPSGFHAFLWSILLISLTQHNGHSLTHTFISLDSFSWLTCSLSIICFLIYFVPSFKLHQIYLTSNLWSQTQMDSPPCWATIHCCAVSFLYFGSSINSLVVSGEKVGFYLVLLLCVLVWVFVSCFVVSANVEWWGSMVGSYQN